MAFLPNWFSASTKAIAEKALERGVLKYPGMCFIEETQSLAWITQDNQIKYIQGDKQITNVKFVGSNLMFYSGDTLLFSYDMSMTEEDLKHVVTEVKKTIGLDQYVKTSDMTTLLDNIIGNLEDKSTVVEYINSLSYNNLSDRPITNMIGSLNTPVYISSLEDGIYKIDYFFSGSPSTEATLTLSVSQNTNPINSSNIIKEISANTDDELSGSIIANLSANDEIGLNLSSNVTATVSTATGTNAYLNIIKIG